MTLFKYYGPGRKVSIILKEAYAVLVHFKISGTVIASEYMLGI